MKTVFYSIAAIALSFNFLTINEVQAIEEGLYWGGGSRYIRIAKQASPTGNSDSDRVCYNGFSPNGSTIVSLKLVIPRYQTGIDYEIYSLESRNESPNEAPSKSNFQNVAIQQNAAAPDKITIGKLVGRFVREGTIYKRDGYADFDGTPELQECLNSTEPYFKEISSGRDRR